MLHSIEIFVIYFLCLILTLCNCNEFDDRIELDIQVASENSKDCIEYFKYVRSSDGYIFGKLTLPHVSFGDQVQLDFRTELYPVAPASQGFFLPDEPTETIIAKLQNADAITYRIDFPFYRYTPHLSNISINDNTICTAKPADYPNKISVQHILLPINNTILTYNNNILTPHFVELTTCGGVYAENFLENATSTTEDAVAIQRGEFPWLSAIYKKEVDGTNFICGGSLVSKQIVLTTAHYIKAYDLTAENILVYLGRHRLDDFSEDNIVVKEVASIVIHPDYNPRVAFPDANLAILKMIEPVSFTKFIQPICLWNEPPTDVKKQTGILVGWGNDENGYTISNVPKKAKLDILTKIGCTTTSSNLTTTALPTDRTLYAGQHNRTGLCKWDSGGGLMIITNGTYMLRGIISAGLLEQEHCDAREYTVYTDVVTHSKWLEQQIGKQEMTISGTVPDVCGISSRDKQSDSRYEWLAAVYFRHNVGELFQCTGVLISARTVLASSQCIKFRSADFFRVYLGRYDLKNINEKNVIVRDVAAVIQHPGLVSLGRILINDISLLQMKTTVGFTAHIKPICMWNKSIDESSSIIGENVTLSSWNFVAIFNGTLVVPQSKEVQVVAFERCQTASFEESLSSIFLCTPSFSDNYSGFLFIKRNRRWFLRGIGAGHVYYSAELEKLPYRVYSDIVHHSAWIESNMLL